MIGLGELGDWQKRSDELNAGELREAINNSGKDFIDYDPVGLPDDEDRQNIVNIIRNFEKARPGVIDAFLRQARAEREAQPAFVLPGKSDVRRRVMTLPTGLFREIEEAYPLMFRNKQHLEWFKKNFSQFLVRDK